MPKHPIDPLSAIFEYTANVVEDFRSKLIDEGWFGRTTPEMPTATAWIDTPAMDEPLDHWAAPPTFEDLWATAPTIETEQVLDDIGELANDLGLDL